MGTSQYEKLCRICTIEQIEGIFIFSEEGKILFLEVKIKKYLDIVVSPDDALPTLVCRSCVRRLDSVHQFAAQALEAQERLQLTINTNPEITENGRDSISSGNKEHAGPDVVDGVTEVEVRVDPMSFLCLLEDADELTTQPTSDVGDRQGGMFRLTCPECSDLTFDTFTQLDTHCRGTHGTRGVAQCRECGQQVSRRSRIAAHRRHHKGDCALYSCDVCGKGFSLRCLLKRHRANHVSDEEKPFLCSMCPRGFVSDVSLRNHLWGHFPRGRHLMLSPDDCQRFNETIEAQACFVCPLCGKILSTKGNLKVHLETHRPKGKYGCDICGRIFKTQSNLYRHKEYHKGKQFPCPECGRVYPTRSTLRAHSITHSDLRPHGCPYCEKTFKRNQDLKFHLNQHTGARPYKCPYCPKAFASSGNCFSHRKRMHGKEVERDREHLQ